MANKNILFLLMLFVSLGLLAQDELKPLGGSSVLMQAWKQKKQQAQTQKLQNITAQFLPFSDDFSYPGPYPDPTRWVNSNSVFINHTKAIQPITIGVATFDGLMANGYPYNAAATTGSAPSDTLTSIPLRLDSLNNVPIIPTDSVILRFYWQARGIWEAPESTDDLILEFYNLGTNSWDTKWSHSGFNPLSSDTTFKRVMIVIDDTSYLKNGFQFRFRNHSTACGDVDHWHLDGIFIDKNVNPKTDTIVPEIAFTKDAGSLLKNYSQMPFNQFSGAIDMLSNFTEYYNLRNNNNSGVNLTTYYTILNNTGTVMAQNTNGTNNVLPYGSGGYCSDPSLVNPSLNGFTYGSGPFADSTSYLLKFYATNISDNFHTNDTIYYRQKFHNYFAYDDGSAEAGYGIGQNGGSNTAVGAFTAVRYTLNVPDTLRALDIFFDPVYGASQLQNAGIRLYVWADNGNLPGTVLTIDSTIYPFPVFSTSGFDVMQRYQLSAPVTFTSAVTFYIGVWQQLGLPLYIGYDLNTDHHTQVLFRTPNDPNNTGWSVSGFKGSLMMRPVFGDSSRAVGIKNFETASAQKEKVLLYPNPATDEVFVNAHSGLIKIVLCDLLGNTLLETTGTKINTTSLPNGLYLVKTYTSKGSGDTQKLFIAR